ncbi:MAG: lamin tail domain-containing protein [Myxococcota bacterium]
MNLRAFTVLTLALGGAACSGPANNDTTCKGHLAGDLVVTEFMNDPEGIDTGKEYIELYNATGEAIDLKGFTLSAGKTDGSRPSTHLIREGVIPSGGYFVLGDVREATLPAHVHYSYADGLTALGNTEGLIGVRCGETVLDEVTYTTAGQAAHARTLDGALVPNSVQNDDESKWCDAQGEFSPGSFGSPGFANASCPPPAGSCTDPLTQTARAVVSPNVGELVISELMADPAAVADTEGEWFEVFARADVDLNGLELSNGTSSTVVSAAGCLRVSANGSAVFVRNLDPVVNGGISTAAATFGFSLTNSGGTLSVKNGAVVIDSISYTSSASGMASQLDPTRLDATANDSEANFCPATATYGAGDKGTPGAANSACQAVANPDQCIDALTSQPRALVRPAVGDLVITEYMANPSGTDTGKEWFEVWVKADVDLNGVEAVNATTGRAAVTSASCVRPGADQYVLFAGNADAAVNGGLPAGKVVATVPNNFLVNTNGRITLRTDAGTLDEVSYATVGDGISTQLSSDGGFCQTSTASTYGGDPDAGTPGQRGTPGLPNELCP